MKTRMRVTGVFFALCALLAGSLPAHAAVLVGTQGTSFYSMTTDLEGFFTTFQPVSDIFVNGINGNNVPIGGFGVYGAAEQASQIRFVIFENGNPTPIRQSAPRPVEPGSADWHDYVLDAPLELTIGQTYSMGLMANNLFAWKQNTELQDGYFGPISGDGLTLLLSERHAQVGVQGQGDEFSADPLLQDGSISWYQAQTSIRVFDAGGALPAVPEPAEWSMLIAGLVVIGFVANRRRRLAP